jgi:hypothetical protein
MAAGAVVLITLVSVELAVQEQVLAQAVAVVAPLSTDRIAVLAVQELMV